MKAYCTPSAPRNSLIRRTAASPTPPWRGRKLLARVLRQATVTDFGSGELTRSLTGGDASVRPQPHSNSSFLSISTTSLPSATPTPACAATSSTTRSPGASPTKAVQRWRDRACARPVDVQVVCPFRFSRLSHSENHTLPASIGAHAVRPQVLGRPQRANVTRVRRRSVSKPSDRLTNCYHRRPEDIYVDVHRNKSRLSSR